MKISACYIVKNEEHNLAKSIESLKKAVDEIIVVDTGSDDNTKKIAASFGAKIFDFTWQDDFASVRNYALSKAEGQWIVFIDADEYFTEASSQQLRSYIKSQHKAGKRGAFLVHRHDIDVDNNNELLVDVLVLRIFFKNSSYAYKGIIHEELMEDDRHIEDIHIVSKQQLLLLHSGYSTSVSYAKAKRNLTLLQKELSTTDNPSRLYMFLADAYLGIDDKEKAKYYAELDVAQGRRPTTYASRSYRILLQLSLDRGESANERLSLCEASVHDFPENPEFRADLAECLAVVGDYKRAVEEMNQAITAYENYRGIEPMLMTPEQVAIAKERMAKWKQNLQPVTPQELTAILWMLILVCLHLTAEQYSCYVGKNLLPQGYRSLLDGYHGIGGPVDDSMASEYLKIVKKIIDRQEIACLEKMLTLIEGFSDNVRGQVVAVLDKKIIEQERQELED